MQFFHPFATLRQFSRWFAPRSRWQQIVSVLLVGIIVLSSVITTAMVLIRHSSMATGAPNHPKPPTTTVIHPPPATTHPPFTPGTSAPPFARTSISTMPPLVVPLPANQAVTATTPNGRVTISVPVGAVMVPDSYQQTSAAATLAYSAHPASPSEASLSLRITQVAPASGSNAGGTVISFGTYAIALVDASGKTLPYTLRSPVTLTLTYGTSEMAFDLTHVFVVVNNGKTILSTHHDATKHTLSVTLPTTITTPKLAVTTTGAAMVGLANWQSIPNVTTVSWDTNPSLAQYGAPDAASQGLNAGAFSTDIPIDVPAGPDGLAPPLALHYNSAAVSDQHSPRVPAGWVGEGWSLDMGKISWSEHSPQTSQSGMGCCSFENQWHWTDPYGVSTDLIPPTNATGLYLDDSPNSISPSPIQWHAASENYAQIYSIMGANALPDGHTPPCFQVFLANGYMEEYGCTADSLQYYATAGTSCNASGKSCYGQYYVANWLLDLIQDAHGNQIKMSYQSINGGDVVLSGVFWGYVSKTPAYKVLFSGSYLPTSLTNTPMNCNQTLQYRCDDPLDLSGSGGLAAPKLMGQWVLNDLVVQTLVGGPVNPWRTVRSYWLSYEQNGPQTIVDPVTDKTMSVAGYLDLTKVQEYGSDGNTTLPPITMSYTTQTEYYEDSAYQPQSLNNCGAIWNTGKGGNCPLWSWSYDGNSRYLATIDNGQGLHQVLTWNNARNNTHGTPTSGSPADPFYCDTHQFGYPCNAADDQAWSRIVLTELDSMVNTSYTYGGGTQYTTPITSKTVYRYQLTYPLLAQDCGDCVAGMYWGDQTDTDFLDYYNERFMGFAQVSTSQSDGSVQVYTFYSTEGIGVYDPAKVTGCIGSTGLPVPCQSSPWWDTPNAAHGRANDVREYATDGVTLLKEMTDVANLVCPPSGVAATPQYQNTVGPWDGNLVAELDHGNPVAVCDVQHGAMNTYVTDGSTTKVQTNLAYTYDSLGRITDAKQQDMTGTRGTTDVQTTYVWTNDLNIGSSGWGGIQPGSYKIDTPAQIVVADGNGNHASCEQRQYDYQPYQTGQVPSVVTTNNGPTQNSTELLTELDHFTSCGVAPSYTPSGVLDTSYEYRLYPGVNTGNISDGTSTGYLTPNANYFYNNTQYRGCNTQEDPVYRSVCVDHTGYLVSSEITQNLTTNITYNQPFDPSYGFGLWPKSTTDPNGHIWGVTYDPFERVTSTFQPGESSSAGTTTTTYTNFCPTIGASTPCFEIDTTQRLINTTTVTTRNFYDGEGHLVETRTPNTNGQDTVEYTLYDGLGRTSFQSIPYLVTAYTGSPGLAAYSVPDYNQSGSSLNYDGLGRVTYAYNAQSQFTSYTYTTLAGVGNDPSHYEQVITLDANNHRTDTLIDALGRTAYSRSYTGNWPWTLYATTSYSYDAADRLITVTDPLGKQSVRTYDGAGRLLTLHDPDLGNSNFTYDADGNLIKDVGPVATSYLFYDPLDRLTSVGPNADGSNPLATWVYDQGINSKGRLISETFSNPGITNGASGEYDFGYDARGNLTNWTMQIGPNMSNLAKYPFSFGFNDANQQTSVTYPDGDLISTNLSAQDMLNSVTETPKGSSTSLTLAGSIGYAGPGGAAGLPTSANVGNNSSNWSFTYNNLLQLRDTNVQSAKNPLYDQKVTYDPVGNVQTVDTTVPAGTDNQRFCYDELNRLISASTSTTTPCGTQMPGTLTTANYSQSFAYDVNNRLISSPAGTYSYGSSTVLNGATQIGSSYTASYDAAGNMICRSVVLTQPCSGSATTMSYDIMNRLQGWQDNPAKPTHSAQYSYDGGGQRVQQTSTDLVKQMTTTTQYIGSYEQISTTGGTTTTTKYYDAGVTTAVNVNGTISYLVPDYLDSPSEALTSNNSTATVKATQLFAPYGGTRYSSGAMPSTLGFTGQQGDPSGLVYMNARYYDPVAGQFTSADTVQGPNRFGYVNGNPTTLTDPTGHLPQDDFGGGWTTSLTPAARAEELAAEAAALEERAIEAGKAVDAAKNAYRAVPSPANLQRMANAGSASVQANRAALDARALATAAAEAARVGGTVARIGWWARFTRAVAGFFEGISEFPLYFTRILCPSCWNPHGQTIASGGGGQDGTLADIQGSQGAFVESSGLATTPSAPGIPPSGPPSASASTATSGPEADHDGTPEYEDHDPVVESVPSDFVYPPGVNPDDMTLPLPSVTPPPASGPTQVPVQPESPVDTCPECMV